VSENLDITLIAIDAANPAAAAALDELEWLTQARVLEAVCNYLWQGRELRSKRHGSRSEETE
jgi:2-methylcitrate dehydratase PrpD